ncbi:MAG: phytanoyl-CoA dioxygenase family protein [Janthinobacterium lividum]
MQVRINQQAFTYDVQGEAGLTDGRVLLATDDDLTAGTTWAAEGYTVADFLPLAEQTTLREGLAQLVRRALADVGHPVPADFDVAHYHRVVGDDRDLHLAVVNRTKEYQQADFLPLSAALLEQRVGELCGRPVQALNPWDGERFFHLRIIRPGKADNNPMHRDVWLPDYHNCLNIYVPVAGSTAHSSLTLVPGSHHWPENRTLRTAGGAVSNGVTFTVPGVLGSAEPLDIIRPNPGVGEVLLFSPYLLHGGAVNLNANETRISLEMRFWAA